jgi:hypothetical protein
MATKEWTFSEKIFLYKFVKENGSLWTEVSKILECSVEAARNQYRNTNWKDFFKKYAVEEKKIDKYTDKEIEKLKTIYIHQECRNQRPDRVERVHYVVALENRVRGGECSERHQPGVN